MTCARIMYDNYTDSDVVNAATYSSQNVNFPASNLYDQRRRARVWRTQGYWNIESGSNEIEFEETTSVPLTASVAIGEYTSTSDFLTALKTAMDAAGASTYTISLETSGKFNFSSNLAGGGGIFSINWTNSTAMAGILGYDDSTDDTGGNDYVADELRIATSEWLKWDFGLPTNPKAFIAIGNRNEAIQLSPSATFTLEGNETDAWSSPSYSQTVTYQEFVLALFGDTGLHTEGLRWWRFKMDDLENPNLYHELSNIFLGDMIILERGAVNFPFRTAGLDRSQEFLAIDGSAYYDRKQKTERFVLDWRGLTKSEKEEFDSLYEEVGKHTPFFIQMDSDPFVSDTSNYYLRYVRMTSDLDPQLISPNNWSASMELREVL